MAASIFWSILMKKAQAWSLGDVEVKFYSIVELIVNYNVIFATLFLKLLMLKNIHTYISVIIAKLLKSGVVSSPFFDFTNNILN